MSPPATRVWLSIIMAGVLLKEAVGKYNFLEGVVSEYMKHEGQLVLEGRTIIYNARVRPQSFPLRYDATARDVATGLSDAAENVDDPQEAYHRAVANLLALLRHRGLIKDQSGAVESDSSQRAPDTGPVQVGTGELEPVRPSLPDDKANPSRPQDQVRDPEPSPSRIPGQDAAPPDPSEDVRSETTSEDESIVGWEGVDPSDPVPPIGAAEPIEEIPRGDEEDEKDKSDNESSVQDQLSEIGGIERTILLFVVCTSTAILKCLQSLGSRFVFISLALALAIGGVHYLEGRGLDVFVACTAALTVCLFIQSSPAFLRAMYQGVVAVHGKFKPSKVPPALEREGVLLEVKPDCQGSYNGYVMQAAKPTEDMLSPIHTYKLWTKCKGLAYILNNRDFEHGQRLGSEMDMKNVDHLFKELGYEIRRHSNLTGEEILSSFKSFASIFNIEGAGYNSAVLVLMSHGDTGVIFGTDLVQVKIRDLQRELEAENCPGLKGKPKLYFIQACRTSAGATRVVTDDPTSERNSTASGRMDQADTPQEQSDTQYISNIKDKTDVHLAFATVDGDWGLRSETVGSFFVQALCEVFFASAHLDNLDTLMNKVTGRVNRMRGYLYDNNTKQLVLVNQTPECVKSMRKALYFFPKYAKKK